MTDAFKQLLYIYGDAICGRKTVLPENCDREKIAEATDSKINLAPTNFAYLYSVSPDFWELTLNDYNVNDGFQTSFKKK